MNSPIDPAQRHSVPAEPVRTVAEVMSRQVRTLPPDATLTEAAQCMAEARVSCVVVQINGEAVGILTERDLLRLLTSGAQGTTELAGVMSSPVTTVQQTERFQMAWPRMLEQGLRHLPVVDENGKLVGVITETDARQHLGQSLLTGLGSVTEVMEHEIPELEPEASLADALALMLRAGASYVLISREHRALGILTERDVPALMLQHAQQDLALVQLASVASHPVHAVGKGFWLTEAAACMQRSSVRHLAVVDDQGLVVGMVQQHDLMLRISSNMRHQNALREQMDMQMRTQKAEERLTLAADAAQMGFWELDVPNSRFRFSGHMQHLMGVQAEQAYSHVRQFLSRVHASDLEQVKSSMQATLSQGEGRPLDMEYRVYRLDGALRWLHSRGQVVQRDEQGLALRAVGVTTDITTRKEQEASLAAAVGSLEQRQSLLEQLSQTINRSPVVAISWATSNGWPVTFVSDNIRQWGYERTDFMGGELYYESLVHPEDLPRINAEIATFFAQSLDSYDQRYRLRAADGRWLWIDDHTWIERDRQGRMQRVHGMLSDVTESHTLQQTARIERDMLENLARGVPLKTLLTQLTDAYPAVMEGMRCSIHLDADDSDSDTHTSTTEPCCTFPILNGRGQRLGDFAVYVPTTRPIHKHETNALERGAYLAGLALERASNEATLRKLWQAVEQSPNSIVITDLQSRIEYANQSFYAVTGYTPEEVLGSNPSMLQSGKTDPQVYTGMWEQLTEGNAWTGEFTNRRKDGSEYIEAVRISPVHQADGSVTHYLAIKEDITHRKESEQQIHRLAYFDTLTGLPNRLLLADRFKQAVSMAERQQEPLAVMFIDLDHFKNINDTLGHRAGDALLIETALRLNSVLRAGDTLSRQGGDEFVLVLPGCGDVQAALVAEKLLESGARSVTLDGHDVVVTLSVGIALYPSDGTDFDALSKAADVAMYRAKEEGRNTYRFFKADMQTHSARTLTLENHLRLALERNELVLVYQPQMSLANGRLVGAEALLRWHHPTLGVISPVEFIPLAESTGLILPIGEWVLRTAMQQLKAWMADGLGNITMAVNLSAVQFRDAGLVAMVSQVLQDTDVPPGLMELELTESVAMDDPLGAVVAMDEMSALGVAMSIDDFGTGYSSLSYLKRFKVGKLKIDKSFVRDITTDPDDKAIASAIIGLASSLGLSTIAEGVETPGQLAWLRLQGCDEAQGYFFSPPLSAPDFVAWVRNSGLAA